MACPQLFLGANFPLPCSSVQLDIEMERGGGRDRVMTCMARDVREQFAYRSRKSGLRCLRHLQLIRVSGFGVQMILIDSRSFPAETLKGLEFETSRPAYLCLHISEPACSVGSRDHTCSSKPHLFTSSACARASTYIQVHYGVRVECAKRPEDASAS